MRALRIALVSLVFGLTAAGCAIGVAIGIDGSRRWIPALAGEWDGTWLRHDRTARGTLWLSLREAHTHVYGHARMAGPGGAFYPRFYQRDEWRRDAPDTWLEIRWTRPDGSALEGVIEPYWDARCHCRAMTTLRGYLRRDVIEGTFVTRYDDGIWVTGTWEAARWPRRREWR